MTQRKRLVLGSNLLLVVVTLFIGVVCLFPVTTAASGSDSIYRQGNREGDGVSLLINVYWGSEQVNEMLDILDEYGARATFFIGGCWADDNVDTLKNIVKHGHEIGSHGYFHKDCSSLSFSETKEEINLSRKLILQATGVDITLFAPPSGDYDDTTVEVCEAENLKMVLWSRDTIDWRDKDEALTFERATKDVAGGEFVLMHPMETTVRALPKILKYYQDNGLRAVTVTENITYGGES